MKASSVKNTQNFRSKIIRFSWLVALLIGVVILLLSVLFDASNILSNSAQIKDGIVLFIQAIGNAFFAASIIALLFQETQSEQTKINLENAIEQIVNQILLPMRHEMLASGYGNYKWQSLVVRGPDYQNEKTIDQHTRISYEVSEIVESMRVVASTAPELLDEYKNDPYCVFRWNVQSDLEEWFKDDCTSCFNVKSFYINGKSLTISDARVQYYDSGIIVVWDIDATKIASLGGVASSEHFVDFQVFVRRIWSEGNLQIVPTIYKHATDAEFDLIVDKDVTNRKVEANDFGVKPLVKSGTSYIGDLFSGSNRIIGKKVRFYYPIMSRSSINFDIYLNK